MTRVLYTYPARWLDDDPPLIAFRDPALAEHPEAKALLDQLNTARQWEAEAGRALRDLQAENRQLRDESAWGAQVTAEDTSDAVWGRAA